MLRPLKHFHSFNLIGVLDLSKHLDFLWNSSIEFHGSYVPWNPVNFLRRLCIIYNFINLLYRIIVYNFIPAFIMISEFFIFLVLK